MNPAPLPQPAPFTCPNCGAGLETNGGLCPRCGAWLEQTGRSSPSLGATIGLMLGLLVFGALGACSGSLVIQSFGPQSGELTARDLLIFSVPLLLVGLIGFGLCLRPFFGRKR